MTLIIWMQEYVKLYLNYNFKNNLFYLKKFISNGLVKHN